MTVDALRLVDLSAARAAEQASTSDLVILPIGSIEQHGPHLPLVTDTLIAEAAASAVEAEPPEGVRLRVLPTLSYTTSSEHVYAAGTMSVSESTLLALLHDIGESVSRLGARRLVLLNGHGGNTALLRVACRQLRLRFGLLTFLTHPMLSPDHGGSIGPDIERGLGCHANYTETSVMLHLRPDLVEMDLAADHLPVWLEQYDSIGLGKPVTFGWSADDFDPSGVIGDPTQATAEVGAAIWSETIERLRTGLAEVARFEFPTAASDVSDE